MVSCYIHKSDYFVKQIKERSTILVNIHIYRFYCHIEVLQNLWNKIITSLTMELVIYIESGDLKEKPAKHSGQRQTLATSKWSEVASLTLTFNVVSIHTHSVLCREWIPINEVGIIILSRALISLIRLTALYNVHSPEIMCRNFNFFING